MSDKSPAVLRDGDIFGTLEPAQRAAINRLVKETLYPSGQVLHSPESAGEHLFVLQSGRVRLYKISPEGRALTLMLLEPVSIFGEMSLVGAWMHDSFAETVTDCLIGVIDREGMQRIVERYPPVALCFMELMGHRLCETESKLADIAFKSVPQRLATVLLTMATTSERPATSDALPMVVRHTHQQLAEMIGSYRETVTKAIGEFREAGLIRVEEEVIYLTNLEKLQFLARK